MIGSGQPTERRFQKNQNEKAAENDIRGRRIADAESQIVERYHWNVGDGHDRDDCQRPIDNGNAKRSQPRRCGGLVVSLAGKRENKKDETEYEGKVNTAMHHFRQKAETRSVIVEDGKCDQQRANDAGCERPQRAKTNLGVEFLF